jgi:hypothetical protein
MASPHEPRPTTILLLLTAAAYIGVLVLYFKAGSGVAALSFSPDGIQNVGRTLAPLVAMAAFIERAVEIAIATSRGPGTLELKRALAAAEDAEKDAARRRLDEYKLYTQRYSFAISLGLSLFASMVGVRAVTPLLTAQPTNRYYNLFDVLITSLLLAGGCDGIHQVVTTITTMLDTSKSNNKQKAAPP